MKESVLTDKLHKYLKNKYGANLYFNNNHSDGYGNQGMPDLLIKAPSCPFPIFVEMKRADTFKAAVSDLRPKQRGHILSLLLSGCQVYLTYDGGTAKASGITGSSIDWSDRADTTKKFDALASYIEELKNE